MKIKTLFTVLLFFVTLASCAPKITVTPTETVVRATSTPDPSATSIPRPSPTATEYFSNSLECIYPEKIQGAPALNGSLLTIDDSNDVELYNLKTNEKLTLGRVVIGTGVISKYQKIAYIDGDKNQVKIVSSGGEILFSVAAPENWIEILDWPDSEHLLIGNMPFRSDGGWYPPSSTIFLNITNGQSAEFLPDYPDIYKYISGPPRLGKYSYSLTAYDPSMTRVVYPVSTSENEYVILWDVQEKQEITRFQNHYPFGQIAWNANGTSFVISIPPYYKTYAGKTYSNVSDNLPYVGGNEIFLANRDGESKRLTFWTTQEITTIHSFSWSPNNEYVAFWLEIGDEKPTWQLAVMEIKTSKITNYCIEDEGSLDIVWSSDSSKLISTISKDDFKNHESILVDLQSEKSTIWSFENNIIVGWFDTIR